MKNELSTCALLAPEIYGTKLGRVPSEMNSNCTTYVPGVRFKGGQVVMCETMFARPTDFDVPCLINGIIQ